MDKQTLIKEYRDMVRSRDYFQSEAINFHSLLEKSVKILERCLKKDVGIITNEQIKDVLNTPIVQQRLSSFDAYASTPKLCPNCEGSGIVKPSPMNHQECPSCNGVGHNF